MSREQVEGVVNHGREGRCLGRIAGARQEPRKGNERSPRALPGDRSRLGAAASSEPADWRLLQAPSCAVISPSKPAMRVAPASMRPCSSPITGWPSVRPYGTASASAACVRNASVCSDSVSAPSSEAGEAGSLIAGASVVAAAAASATAASAAVGEGGGSVAPPEVEGVASPVLLRQCQMLMPEQTNGGLGAGLVYGRGVHRPGRPSSVR